jgi:hypothetical protein
MWPESKKRPHHNVGHTIANGHKQPRKSDDEMTDALILGHRQFFTPQNLP